MTGEINPIGLATTGIGLGIMTMGAMVPLIVMKQIVDNGGVAVGKSGKGIKLNLPKMNTNFTLPNIAIKKVKIR